MASETPDIAELARDIRAIAETLRSNGSNAFPFTAEEVARIKRGAQIVEWFDTLGWLGKRVLALTGAIVVLIANWERIVTALFGGGK